MQEKLITNDINSVVDDITSHNLASTYVETEKTQILLRVGSNLKTKWDQMCFDRRITQARAGRDFVNWITSQDPEVQAMIFGSIPWSDQILTRIRPVDILPPKAGMHRRMAARKSSRDGTVD